MAGEKVKTLRNKGLGNRIDTKIIKRPALATGAVRTRRLSKITDKRLADTIHSLRLKKQQAEIPELGRRNIVQFHFHADGLQAHTRSSRFRILNSASNGQIVSFLTGDVYTSLPQALR